MFVQASGNLINPKFAGVPMVKQADGTWTLYLEVK